MLSNSTKDKIMHISGFLFIFIGVLAILKSIYFVKYEQMLWFCWASMILLGIGMLRKNSTLVASQVNLLAIPFIFWTIDFLYVLAFQESFLGISDYFFEPGPWIDKLVTLEHLYVLPLSLLCLYFMKLNRKDMWKASLFQILVVYFMSILFTVPSLVNNVNCVYAPCIAIDLGLPYILQWFIFYTVMLLITNFILVKMFYIKTKDKDSKKNS